MFDLKYFMTMNAISKNADQLNDYSKLKNVVRSREDFENMYLDLFEKYNIDFETYTIMRKYDMLCDAYFKNYIESVCDKKLNYMKRNGVYNTKLTRKEEMC